MRTASSDQKSLENLPVVIVTGPTASGKSALAVRLARQIRHARIINADSMQLYRELPILTAQPSMEERGGISHHLYGILSVTERGTAAFWVRRALAEIRDAHRAGDLPILVGGTGFYLKALIDGLADIPDISGEIMTLLKAELELSGVEAQWQKLKSVDPKIAAHIHSHDRQRILRALSVWLGTGRSLSDWYETALPQRALNWRLIILEPDRADLYRAINRRFEEMIVQGAVDEVKNAGLMGLDNSLPALRAHGVQEILGYLRAECDFEQAIAKAQQATRNYAKRQSTWIRTQWLKIQDSMANPPILWRESPSVIEIEEFSMRFVNM